MPDMWRHRKPPVPLDYDKIVDGSFELRAAKPSTGGTAEHGEVTNGKISNVTNTNGKSSIVGLAGAKLKDQRTLSLKDNLELFISRCV
jgi:ubiquitin-like 1-activating enzyme E1 B